MADINSLQEHHREFSVAAHNQALDLFYESSLTPEETKSLIELAHVAHWHWMKTVLGDSGALREKLAMYLESSLPDAAAEESLSVIANENLLPSYYGYCNEALARAHLLLGDKIKANEYLDIALGYSEKIPTPQAKEYLLDQIERIKI